MGLDRSVCNKIGFWKIYDFDVLWVCNLFYFLNEIYCDIFCEICNFDKNILSIRKVCNIIKVWDFLDYNIKIVCFVFLEMIIIFFYKNKFCIYCNFELLIYLVLII